MGTPSEETILSLREFKSLTGLEWEDVCEIARVPYGRFRRGRPITIPHEGAASLARGRALHALALEISGGDAERADAWLFEKSPALSDAAPIDLIDSEAEYDRVRRLVAALRAAAAAVPKPAECATPPAPMQLPADRKYRLKETLEAILKSKPGLTKAGIARSVSQKGVPLDAAKVSRISMGYSDASAAEVHAIAEALEVPVEKLVSRQLSL